MERYKYTAEARALLEGLQTPFAVYQFLDGRVVTLVLSDGFCELFGYSDRERAYHDMDYNMYMDTHPDDVARIAEEAIRFATEGGTYEVIYRSRNRDRTGYHIIHAMGKHVYTDSGARLAHVWYQDEGSFTEADAEGTALNRALNNALHEESLLNTSQYDYLTGLPNMTRFFRTADAEKAAILERGGHPALMYMDFSGMKFFNFKHGFTAGDKLLQRFAKLLANAFGEECCCRIGADRFAAISEAAGLEDKLRQLFRDFRAADDGATIPVHVGIYPSQLESIHVSVACDRAKLACKSLKGVYDSAFNYYRKEMADDAEKKQYVLETLDTAIREKWIEVYYQPIVRAVNGKICDIEALARWIDPTRGFMSPADFIPVLEDSGQIYKLDLYVLDVVLKKMQDFTAAGWSVVPHSINLSRADFDACDIVAEITKRVDAAGIARDRITIEITESIIGSDFDFMKAQILRFQELGFPVWMDDFGSGYSSLDVLQSVHFDLVKFDMSFMRRLNDGDSGKIILTELMKLSTSLGVDTVCEGVETEEQVRFLQEIGCSKLQGFYFGRPVPLRDIIDLRQQGKHAGYENPKESAYYEAIGRVNLYDLSVIAGESDSAFRNLFDTLPMCILEIGGGDIRYVRSNQSYRDFIHRFFHSSLSDEALRISETPSATSPFLGLLNQCCEKGGRTFLDERMADGSTVHSFARKLSANEVTGMTAIAVVVLSISSPGEGASYANIARALAADYYNIYYVDLEDESFIEYTSPVGGEDLAIERHGEGFFEAARRDTMTRIYAEDRDAFLAIFTRENILRELDKQGVFTYTYRLVDTGKPMYVNMKVTRMQPDGRHLILGVSIVDSQMKQQHIAERVAREESAFARLIALSGDYLSLYSIDPESGRYIEFNAASRYESFGFSKEGRDFFLQAGIDGKKAVYPGDLDMYLDAISRENVLRQIREHNAFELKYRIVIEGAVEDVLLKIVSFRDSDGERLIAALMTRHDGQ